MKSQPLRYILSQNPVLRKMHDWALEKSQLYLRLTAWTSLGRELGSLIRLVQCKGWMQTARVVAGMSYADKQLPYTPFSLKTYTFCALARCSDLKNVHRVLEFGSGNSTLALWYLMSGVRKEEFEIISFENDPEYYDRQHLKFQGLSQIAHILSPLKRLTEKEETDWLSSDANLLEKYSQIGQVQQRAQYESIGTDRMFYAFDFHKFANQSFDLVILDGPQGPGRWYAYPLLQALGNYPFTLLVDDFPMYSPLNRIGDFFETDELDQDSYDVYGYAVYRVKGPCRKNNW